MLVLEAAGELAYSSSELPSLRSVANSVGERTSLKSKVGSSFDIPTSDRSGRPTSAEGIPFRLFTAARERIRATGNG